MTGGEQGFSNVPYPDLGWMSAIPGLVELRVGGHYFYLTLVLVGVCLLLLKRITGSPFWFSPSHRIPTGRSTR